jgi:uncharacterized protein
MSGAAAHPEGGRLSGPTPPDRSGRLLENIMHFARALRAAGLPIGTGRVLDAVRAVEAAGIADRADFYWVLHAVFVNRREQHELFEQAFHIFWRNPQLMEKMLGILLPTFGVGEPEEPERSEISRRVAEALLPKPSETPPGKESAQEIEIDAVMTWSDRELLQSKDFEQMSAEEIRRAQATLRRLVLPLAEIRTRRYEPNPRPAKVDMRASLRAALRTSGGIIPLKFRRTRMRPPTLVVLCDISGSMESYSRMLLHFLHALTNHRDRVHSFLFATRLTNITRQLRHRDVDLALAKVGDAVEDWSGGTRIGECLKAFNRDWSRRVLGQGAVLLLITDGLDRDTGVGLGQEMERLHKSCRRLIWLNPLLRYEGFEPKSAGIRALIPHVDEFRPVHNLESLAELAAALEAGPGVRGRQATEWRRKAAAA